ncbi:hypothetical protein LWI29_021025 [Acer saccharum]|uniref:RING-type E3 ubiquitin transferase n=1 Tax=Acer saccharum TaxID=4024 RepID=A0AA39SZ93_ACESA|nr:hypothetical protein LWI29_021025 [Acer saccharum]
MSFDTSVRDSRKAFAWGYWSPITVGDQIFQWSSGSFMPLSSSMTESSSLEANTSNGRPLNISYKISLTQQYPARRTAPFNNSSSGYIRLRSQNHQTVLLGSGGWLEVHEVIVRIVTMVAFVLQFRLLQLSWSSRIADHNNQMASWIAEKKAWLDPGWFPFPSNSAQHFPKLHRKSTFSPGFLFPQILLNIFQNSTEKVLSPLFYIGYTLIRLVPHAYDLYRANNYILDFDGSYIYADHKEDFYSTAWDASIPLGCILFTAILYFQQRFGSRCFLPRRFRELEVYEKVPAVDGEE